MARYCVGVTGGVAAGKSTVTRGFEALGVCVVDADRAARDVVATGSPGLRELVERFGTDILDAAGALDRAAMRRRVFADEGARRQLEAVVHPRVRHAMHAACAAAPGAYVLAAIPLLAEGGRDAYPWIQRVLVVDAPVALQRARLQARDGIDAALADRMITAQATREARLAIADDVLVNDVETRALDVEIAALDRLYRALADASA